MINFTLLGAGRIGKMHAKIISDHPDANLVNVYDVNQEFAAQVASDNNANAAKSAVDARCPVVVGLRQDRHGSRLSSEPEDPGAPLHQHT